LTDTDSIAQVLSLGRDLSSILEEEFGVLQTKNLEALEDLQDQKVAILQQLDETWSKLNQDRSTKTDDSAEPQINETLWEEAVQLINNCKEAHIRNDLLLKKQLEVVRNVLSALTHKSDKDYGDLYDKMGRVGRKR
jgi:flagellar biosynthesis/type III secretory pathway chaperone